MGYALKNRDNPDNCCRFFVGRSLDGCWIVCDRMRRVGGYFADKDSAVHFALAESEHQPGAVWCAHDDDCLISDPWGDLSTVAHAHRAVRPEKRARACRSRQRDDAPRKYA